MNKSLWGAKLNYPLIEKFALVLIISAKQLQSYVQAHSIQVITNNFLKFVLAKPNHSKRLLKWSWEFNEFDISYSSRLPTKAQAVVDFLVDFNNLSNITINLNYM